MQKSVRPTDEEIENAVKNYSNTIFRLCFTMLASSADAEDAASETMLRYITRSRVFSNEEHKKAWLLRVASNVCRDMLRRRRCSLSLDDIASYGATDEDTGVMSAVLQLESKYKSVIYLHYIEGYTTSEIAQIVGISPSAVRKRLQYGREKLKIELEADL